MIRKSGIRFSEKIMLKRKPRGGGRSNHNSSRSSAHLAKVDSGFPQRFVQTKCSRQSARQAVDRKRTEDRVALADLADFVVVGTVGPCRYLLGAVPDLNNDA